MAVEHLHLHLRRTHWETKSHTNLGACLQDALDELDKDGWEVVSVFCIDRTPEIIMKREKIPSEHFAVGVGNQPPALQA